MSFCDTCGNETDKKLLIQVKSISCCEFCVDLMPRCSECCDKNPNGETMCDDCEENVDEEFSKIEFDETEGPTT
ncbi:hypothetical protein LCGC14_1040340 [marine sediment metagenome]|uniref:Uncharacterized protein n=1 Tax=marine sediment metagenome TaxID=412755 RepID=A0A0F9MRT6_9ZZZZ